VYRYRCPHRIHISLEARHVHVAYLAQILEYRVSWLTASDT
jgi:hypothetical protein